VYSGCICGSVLTCSVSDPFSFNVEYVCCATLEFTLLAVIAWTCSLKRVRKFLPVWPTYFNGESLHFSR
jgi:hypothetical protein